jgi:uncharacterized Zn finger protein
MDATIPSAWLSALSDRQLKRLSSDAIFSRAQSYVQEVRDIHVPTLATGEQIAAHAKVQGSKRQPYVTRVWINSNDELEGVCTCPNAEEGYFCKHQVAVSLKLRQFLNNETATVVAVKAKADAAPASTPLDVRAFLTAQSHSALVDKLCLWAQSQPSLMSVIEQWAQPMTPSSYAQRLTQLKAQLTDIIVETAEQSSDYEYYRYRTNRRSRGYNDDDDDDMDGYKSVSEVVTLLGPLAVSEPVLFRELFAHVWEAFSAHAEDLSGYDDESSDFYDTAESLVNSLRESLIASPPPVEWFQTWMELSDLSFDPYDNPLDDEHDSILDVVGPAVQAAYAVNAEQKWHAWLKKNPPTKDSSTDAERFERHAVRRQYLNALRLQGDVTAQIEVMRHSLVSAEEHLELATLLEKNGRLREGLQQLETAARLYPHDHRIQEQLLVCYERDGCDEEAWRIRHQQLQQHPSAAHYQAALKAAQAAGRDVAAYRAELFAWAAVYEKSKPSNYHFDLNGEVIRIHWLLSDNRAIEALPLLEPLDKIPLKDMVKVAQQLPTTHSSDAVRLFKFAFEQEMPKATSPYGSVLAYVEEVAIRLPKDECAAWMQHLRSTYKTKRNFIKGLNEMKLPA